MGAWGAAPETWGYSGCNHHCRHAAAFWGLGAQQRGCGPGVPAMGLLLGAQWTCAHLMLRASGPTGAQSDRLDLPSGGRLCHLAPGRL